MNKILINVKTNSKEQKIIKINENSYKVLLKAVPKDGEANKELLEILSKYFNLPKTHLEIKSGHTSRRKVVLVPKI